MDGLWYPTVEHYFQSQKFLDAEYREKVRRAPTAKDAANLGRSRRVPLREDWEQVKDEIMMAAVMAKFRTHKDIRELLLSTNDEAIIENAPGDYYWGCGKDGTGENRLGHILEDVRHRIASEI